jgi:hypothetical protein
MITLKQRLSGLLTVKSIVTFSLTAVFIYLAVIGEIKSEIFMPIYTSVLSFYFGTQFDKDKGVKQ